LAAASAFAFASAAAFALAAASAFALASAAAFALSASAFAFARAAAFAAADNVGVGVAPFVGVGVAPFVAAAGLVGAAEVIGFAGLLTAELMTELTEQHIEHMYIPQHKSTMTMTMDVELSIYM